MHTHAVQYPPVGSTVRLKDEQGVTTDVVIVRYSFDAQNRIDGVVGRKGNTEFNVPERMIAQMITIVEIPVREPDEDEE